MNPKKRKVLKWGLALAGGTLALSGCGGGGDGSSTGGGTGTPPPSDSVDKARVSGRVAQNDNSETGALDGIRVSAGGRNDTTDSGGNFDMRDVEPGTQRVSFESDRNPGLSKSGGPVFNAPVTGSLVVDIPAGGSIVVNNARIRADVVTADSIVITSADGEVTTIPGSALPRLPDLPDLPDTIQIPDDLQGTTVQ